MKNEVIIVGGGLAGLTAGIHLAKKGISVTLFEKNSFPKHKVCGEFISNEILPYLRWLDADPEELNPVKISRAQFSMPSGKMITTHLPLGGFGISRFELDYFLLKKAVFNGVKVIEDTVEEIALTGNEFQVKTNSKKTYSAAIVLGAYGKRSNLDIHYQRKFIQKQSPWLAIKAHYQGELPEDIVGLHYFKGGYCGVSMVENNLINVCYLADVNSFKPYKDIEEYQREVLSQNPYLKKIFENFKPVFKKPLTISQISFAQKEQILHHILLLGDTAGLIHPLCGNGMAMAIHSAKIASELIIQYFDKTIPNRKSLERRYTKEWNKHFKMRIRTGRLISFLLNKKLSAHLLFQMLLISPFLLQKIIQKTHGKPISIQD